MNFSPFKTSLSGHSSVSQTMAFSNNEDKLATGSSTGSIRVWDLENNKCKFFFSESKRIELKK